MQATHIALRTTRNFLESELSVRLIYCTGYTTTACLTLQVSKVIFVVFSQKDEEVYRGIVPEYFPGPDSDQSA